MKKIIALFIALLVANQLQAQKKFTVKGSFKNYEGKVCLYSGKKDSVYTKNGQFVFEGTVDVPYQSYVSIPSGQRVGLTPFWIDEGETILELDTIPFKNSRFSGIDLKANVIKAGRAHQIMDDFLRGNNEIWSSSISEAEKNQKMKSATDKMLFKHPNTVLSLYALSANMKCYEKDELEKLYATFSPSLQKTENGLAIKNKYVEVLNVVVGGKMPNFTQTNQYGKPVSLNDFKGKYVLVDFWASWCIPCRKENPVVVKAYQNFKPRGFDILAVSFDHDKEAWLKAIANDNLSWTHVSDLGGWQNVLAKTFKVTSVPSNYLVDPNGVVIAKDLHGEELAKKLAEIFEAK
ncbi:MAG: AhpC/TSA family protein [Pedobacter sp.]|nr:MAG: AhpC/TSA family protein [Pedobacter sp.]